ncbi:hypothetical protein M4578_23870 [Salipiger sp. P9]|uniref:hypothetical protein n=1 Tax=Salipiger pentaromativorans TaxID=2943193 RepID=UPI00215856DB|nr:hypothetical protein [Salipiger pentaromativorans]MCR8550875.1 hypothetical protein [Salipiger pentaromativorans]
MILTFSPMRRDDALALSVAGDVLTINGEPFDFSVLSAGATLPCAAISCGWIAGDVERDAAGELTVPLVLPHGGQAPQETLFPAPLAVTAEGPVTLPAPDATEEAV